MAGGDQWKLQAPQGHGNQRQDITCCRCGSMGHIVRTCHEQVMRAREQEGWNADQNSQIVFLLLFMFCWALHDPQLQRSSCVARDAHPSTPDQFAALIRFASIAGLPVVPTVKFEPDGHDLVVFSLGDFPRQTRSWPPVAVRGTAMARIDRESEVGARTPPVGSPANRWSPALHLGTRSSAPLVL